MTYYPRPRGGIAQLFIALMMVSLVGVVLYYLGVFLIYTSPLWLYYLWIRWSGSRRRRKAAMQCDHTWGVKNEHRCSGEHTTHRDPEGGRTIEFHECGNCGAITAVGSAAHIKTQPGGTDVQEDTN